MAFGLMLACSSGGGGGGGGDDSGDDDCGEIENPLPSDQCSDFCTQANCTIAVECGYESDVSTCVQNCLSQCQQGCIPASALDCFANFTDCDTLNNCMGM